MTFPDAYSQDCLALKFHSSLKKVCICSLDLYRLAIHLLPGVTDACSPSPQIPHDSKDTQLFFSISLFCLFIALQCGTGFCKSQFPSPFLILSWTSFPNAPIWLGLVLGTYTVFSSLQVIKSTEGSFQTWFTQTWHTLTASWISIIFLIVSGSIPQT